MQYPAHSAFIAPARAFPQFWRLFLGILLIVAAFLVSTVGVFAVAGLLVGGMDEAEAYFAAVMGGETPTGTMLLLVTFVGLFLGPIIAARLLHKRRAPTLFGPWRSLLRGFGVAVLVAVPIIALTAFLPPEVDTEANLSVSLWLSFLPLALALILLQTGAEEVAFRGYLQQQLAARYDNPIIWMLLPAALFALGHYNAEIYGSNAWTVVLATGLFAIFAADLTARTGTIGAAWGFHFANNAAAILVLTIEGPLGGLSLFVIPSEVVTPDVLRPALWRDMIVTAVIWFIIRLALAPKSQLN